MKPSFPALVLIASACMTFAPVLPAQEITLSQAVRLGLQHNPALTGYKFRRNVLDGEQATARLRPETRLHLEAENLAGSGAFSGVDAAEVTLSFSSVVELGGRRDARMGVVTARQQQLETEQRVAVLDLVAALNYRFISLLAAREHLHLGEEAEQLAQALVDSLVKRVQAGSTPQAELMRARAALARTRISLDQARQQAQTEALQLSAFWADPTPDFTGAQGDLLALTNPKPLTEWQARLAQNPDVALLGDATRLRAAELRKVDSESRPALGWTAGIRQLQQDNDTALVLGLSLPLASGTRASGARQAARAEHEAARFAEGAALGQLQTRLHQTFLAHRQALDEALTLRDHIVPLLEDASRATAAAFGQGRYSSLELAMAQRELLEARAELINAALRAHATRIELERLTASAPATAASQEEHPNE